MLSVALPVLPAVRQLRKAIMDTISNAVKDEQREDVKHLLVATGNRV
jgi:hypothetical protein